jgi:hypothetical protein
MGGGREAVEDGGGEAEDGRGKKYQPIAVVVLSNYLLCYHTMSESNPTSPCALLASSLMLGSHWVSTTLGTYGTLRQ